MRYLIPAAFAALLITGCASHQCRHQESEPEQPSVEKSAPVPLLESIPILGFFFTKHEAAQAKTEEAKAEVPLLGDIPIIGHLFKRADKPEDSTPDDDQGE